MHHMMLLRMKARYPLQACRLPEGCAFQFENGGRWKKITLAGAGSRNATTLGTSAGGWCRQVRRSCMRVGSCSCRCRRSPLQDAKSTMRSPRCEDSTQPAPRQVHGLSGVMESARYNTHAMRCMRGARHPKHACWRVASVGERAGRRRVWLAGRHLPVGGL